MLNHIDDAKRRAAMRLVRRGRLYDLSHVLDESVPVFRGRYFRQTLVTTAHHANAAMPLGENQVNWVTEIVSATTQLGTHLDALSHLQIGERGYNGWTVAELAGPAGVKRLGAETIPQIVTRGWLVDVSGDGLGVGDVITVDHLAGIDPEPGDAVLFHTGWSTTGQTPRRTSRASPARATQSQTGSSSAASRSPAATPGATAPCRPRIRRGRSRCRSG
jgi:kynurenine formamidase